MKPIETKYGDILFRSRLEARWAVFFDGMQIPWSYEPCTFDTRAGPYIPDFNLDSATYYAEVKPDWPTKYETDKMRAAADYCTFGVLLLMGPPDFRAYWSLFQKEERLKLLLPEYFSSECDGPGDFGKEAPLQYAKDASQRDLFPEKYQIAVDRALHAKFDGYDQDRWEREARYR